MLNNWTIVEARKLGDLLAAKFGPPRTYHYSNQHVDVGGTHNIANETTQIKFNISFRVEDNSERHFDSSYETTTRIEYSRPITVYASCRRLGNGAESYRALEGANDSERKSHDLLPATVEEWADRVIATMLVLDQDFETKSATLAAERKAEEERLVARVNLHTLVVEGKLTEITFDSHAYDPGDSRTCGALEVTAKTNLGELKLEGTLDSSGDMDDLKVTLDGKEVNDDDLDLFDSGAPHYCSGKRAVKTWEKNAEETLRQALEVYLGIEVKK